MGPTQVIIDHNHLRHNFHLIKELVHPAKILCVIKANAYGHGVIEVSRTLINEGADYMGVAYPEEGIKLRKAGIKIPILLFGVHLSDTFRKLVQYDIDITLTDMEQIAPLKETCRQLNKKARIHIKFDTGMNRVGFRVDQLELAVKSIFSEKLFEVIGVYSHFSSSDDNDLNYTKNQLERFEEIKTYINNKYTQQILYHIANSGAIMQLKDSHQDMVRPGAMLYGYPPDPNFKLINNIKEVMTFASKIVLIKKIDSGEPVSYGRRFYTKAETQIAIIPVGYADGYSRRFTNNGEVIIKGKRYPIIGAVCMDQIIVDLGSDTDLQIGDEVILLGKQGEAYISNTDLCKQLGTIPYEITCGISRRVQRVHINL
jgi:alanine racemase